MNKPIQSWWPEEVARQDDMSPDNWLRICIQKDGDAVIEIITKPNYESPNIMRAEFCTPPGGGHSPATRLGISILRHLIEFDNRGWNAPDQVSVLQTQLYQILNSYHPKEEHEEVLK